MHEYDLVTCRRVNYIQAAMVQAAISIQRTQGIRAAIAVLHEEGVPQDVIDRVLSDDGKKRLWPYTAMEWPASLVPD